MKCTFCEQLLTCKTCGKPFQPRSSATHLGAFQPDMEVLCPACQHVLICKLCGYVYGDPEADSEKAE